MRDIPFFTTENGIASLTLAEIVYKKEAYIRIQSTSNPKELLRESVSFCRAAGAERVYATGHPILEEFPLHTSILRMSCDKSNLTFARCAQLIPVDTNTLDDWRKIYNERMRSVSNAATMSVSKAKELFDNRSACFVYKDNQCIGIGALNGCTVDAVASVVKGSGELVFLTLADKITESIVRVEVASDNKRAVQMYLRLGFVVDEVISKWFEIV